MVVGSNRGEETTQNVCGVILMAGMEWVTIIDERVGNDTIGVRDDCASGERAYPADGEGEEYELFGVEVARGLQPGGEDGFRSG